MRLAGLPDDIRYAIVSQREGPVKDGYPVRFRIRMDLGNPMYKMQMLPSRLVDRPRANRYVKYRGI